MGYHRAHSPPELLSIVQVSFARHQSYWRFALNEDGLGLGTHKFGDHAVHRAPSRGRWHDGIVNGTGVFTEPSGPGSGSGGRRDEGTTVRAAGQYFRVTSACINWAAIGHRETGERAARKRRTGIAQEPTANRCPRTLML